MKKIAALADIHFSKENQDLAFASLECALEVGKREKIDAWTFAGDLFDRGVQNSQSAGFPRLVNVIQRMLEVAPILSIEGTITHDLPGAYSVLCELKAKHRFINLRPEHPEIIAGILFMGLPEVGKEWLSAGTEGLKPTEINQKLMESIRAVLLGFGAIRASHPDLPAVLLFHGAVKGSSLQNRKIMDEGIGRNDLVLVDADIVAYYTGSAYPVDWGEVDQKGFNLVEIGDAATYGACGHIHLAQRICGNEVTAGVRCTAFPYPHAPRRKIEAAWGDDIGAHLPITGDLVWLSVQTPKEQCTSENREIVLQKLLANGALEGSRVTLEPVISETVRAAEIAKATSLRHKYEIWIEASEGLIASLSVAEKADWLEAQAERSGALPTSFLYHLRKVKVRGAKGIWKGLRVDDVEIDFDALDPGLIALIGSNGEGKTTLAENCHPYSRMMTREGTLQDHFRLRDSLREVTFSNDATGEWYRSRMEIDGKNKTGGTKYHLARRHSDNGSWEPITDGTKDSYDAAILGLLGSFELFTRSAFVPQRPSKTRPALYEATKGEKKDLFRELAGLDYLQAYAENAKEKAGVIEEEIANERSRINLIESQLTALPGIIADVDSKRASMVISVEQLEKLEVRGKALAAEAEALAEKVRAQRSLAERIEDLEGQVQQKRQEILDAETEIGGFQKALKEKPTAQAAVEAYERLKNEESKENERIAKISVKREQLTTKYGDAQKDHSDACRALEASKSALRTEKAHLEGDLNVLQAQTDYLAGDLKKPLKENCPTCGQLLPETKLAELKQKREAAAEKIEELRKKHAAVGKQITEIEQKTAAIVLPDPPFPPELPPIDQAPLQRIRRELGDIQIDQARETFATAQEAATRIEETKKRQEEAARELVLLQEQRKAAEGQVDPSIQPAYDQAQKNLEDARKEYGEAAKMIAGLEAQIKAQEQRITELQAQEKDIGERKAKLEEQQAEAAEWRLLERGCGPDGIQALELDAMAPGISEIANNLLRSAYGPRFSLELRTTRTAGKGGKTRQVEDFAIWVLDAECPEVPEAELSMISGGEGVWIARAIAAAFSMIREHNHGVKFLTVIQDEGDSALDDDPRTNARQHFFDMLEGEHAEGGRIQTIVVTHSPEAKDRIPQKVKMADLAVAEKAHAVVA